MIKEKIIINGIDVTECLYRRQNPHNFCMCSSVIKSGDIIELTRYVQCEYNPNCYFKQRARVMKENAELQERTASIIYSLTGGRLSYSTYTLEGCEDAYRDQLRIDVERATKELQEKLQAKEQECEELRGRLNTICFDSRANNNRCISYNRMAEDYAKLIKYKTFFLRARKLYQRTSKYNQQLIDENEDLKDTIKRFSCKSECYKHKEAEKYKQALDEIENYVRDNSDFDKSDKLTSNTGAYDILEIINKAKAVSNAR